MKLIVYTVQQTIAIFILILIGANVLLSQCDNPPNGPGCRCWNAPVLCTPDELDGFTFSMSSEVNDGDLPDGFNSDLCPGIADQDGFPNNVNFFSFIAWCEDLTFDVLVTNCQDNPNDFQES